jgi:PmbA protein
MPRDLADLTDAMLTAARRAGADAADAVAIDSASVSIEVRQGKLEQAERSESLDIGLRVFIGQRQAIVSSSDARDATLAQMAERAVAMAREAPVDPTSGLADPGQVSATRDAAALDLWDDGPEPSAADLETAARMAEAAALAVPGITQSQSADASHTRRHVHMAATNGFSAGNRRTDHSLSATAISGTGTTMQRDWDHDSRIHRADLRDAAAIGRRAGERATAMQGATRPPTGTWPVLFDERIAGSLISHLTSAINGQAIARGQSWLLNALHHPVLPDHLTLTEDPHRRRVPGSRLWDGEGLATTKKAIVQAGILTGWTLDLATGRKLHLPSTANAARSVGSPPAPSLSNLHLTPGAHSRDDLIAQMGEGLYVTSLIGSTINPNTGDYSRGASGFWVKGGQISHPVHECTVAGSLPAMLRRIIPANDARQHISWVIPSLLIDGMVIAGA